MMMSPRSTFSVLAPIAIAVTVISIGGCGDKAQNKTVPGLQEQVKNRDDEISGLKQQIEELKKEKVTSDQSEQARVERTKKDYEDRQAKLEELHRTKTSQLESQVSDLRLELGAVQREKLALREMVEQAPRIRAESTTRKGYDMVVLGVMIAALIAMLLFVAFRYRSAQDRLSLLTMQTASELRRIGAKP